MSYQYRVVNGIQLAVRCKAIVTDKLTCKTTMWFAFKSRRDAFRLLLSDSTLNLKLKRRLEIAAVAQLLNLKNGKFMLKSRH